MKEVCGRSTSFFQKYQTRSSLKKRNFYKRGSVSNTNLVDNSCKLSEIKKEHKIAENLQQKNIQNRFQKFRDQHLPVEVIHFQINKELNQNASTIQKGCNRAITQREQNPFEKKLQTFSRQRASPSLRTASCSAATNPCSADAAVHCRPPTTAWLAPATWTD